MSALGDRVILQDKMFIHTEHCKGCGFCVEFCPKKVLFLSTDYNAKGYHPPDIDPVAKCSNCKLCELLCPEFAIYSTDEDRKGAAAKPPATGQAKVKAAAAGEEARA